MAAFASSAFGAAAAPDLALKNFERWLTASSSPETLLAFLAAQPVAARPLGTALGASQHLADQLIQNPELAHLLFDRSALDRPVCADAIIEEGLNLLKSTDSFTHALDRLRFLKQRWHLPIVVNDLQESWTPETVWAALSELSDAVLHLATRVVWQHHGLENAIPWPPIAVVAYGKLGGHEVNYSSDVDLAYVHSDDLDPSLVSKLSKMCEQLGRALGDRMGRGALYRVDLRLRPYGRAGPIVRSMRSVEAYFAAHAEVWERQALLRSRVVVGDPEMVERWDRLRLEHSFPARISEMAVREMVATRGRIEELAEPDDLKRGPGGIRDVEFLVQAIQMVHGNGKPELRARPTIEALRAMDAHGILDHATVSTLVAAYRFLRQLEHRCQIVGDQQTHTLPKAHDARTHLARLMGLDSWVELEKSLEVHRKATRSLYESVLGFAEPTVSPRTVVGERMGPQANTVLQWFDVFPESDAFYMSLAENEGSLGRIERILQASPLLVQAFKQSLPLTEALASGEIEEDQGNAAALEQLPHNAPPESLARTLRNRWLAAHAAWVLDGELPLWSTLGEIFDAFLQHCSRRLYLGFDVVALGSYAASELVPLSDLDLVFLVEDPRAHPQAEAQAQQLMALVRSLRRYEAPVSLDLRLRPEGGKGLLVRTYDGFQTYELEAMELWERFALGRSRLVAGSPRAEALVRKASYAVPLTPERLQELVAMKRRIETERVLPTQFHRHVKLGFGGLGDIEWFVQLHQMRYPTASRAGLQVATEDRIRELARAQLINAVESEALLGALRYLLRLRTRLQLLGFETDLIPENPDKLERLARLEGFDDPNAFLAHHERVIGQVRSIYVGGLERLGA